MSRRPSIALIAAVAVVSIAGFVGVSQPGRPVAHRAAASEGEEREGEGFGGEERGGENEAQEQAETTEKRLEALAEAKAEGTFGKGQPIVTAAAPVAFAPDHWARLRVRASSPPPRAARSCASGRPPLRAASVRRTASRSRASR